jgi:hypothetical protein
MFIISIRYDLQEVHAIYDKYLLSMCEGHPLIFISVLNKLFLILFVNQKFLHPPLYSIIIKII